MGADVNTQDRRRMMSRAQKWSILVRACGLAVILATFLQWFTLDGESITGIEYGGASVLVVPGGLIVLSAVAAFLYRKRPPLLGRIFFVVLYGFLGMVVLVFPIAAMGGHMMRGPGIPLTALAVFVGGCSSMAWLFQSVPKSASRGRKGLDREPPIEPPFEVLTRWLAMFCR